MRPDRRRQGELGEVSIQSKAEVQLHDGCIVEIATPEHKGVAADATDRIEEIEHQQQRTLSRVLGRLKLSQPEQMSDVGGAKGGGASATATARAARDGLLAGTCAGTADVLDLIDELAKADFGWGWHPVLGMRGRVDGLRPETESMPGEAAARWADGLVCPLAAAIEQRIDGRYESLEDRARVEAAMDDPMAAARREFARVHDLEEAPTRFTMQSAAWGLLVLASDQAKLDEWIADQEISPTAEERETLVKTLQLITASVIETLQPGSPRVTIREPAPTAAPA